jgi:methylthioribose-1-phosphate isomerase
MIRTLYWADDAVVMIDQRALPLTERCLTFRDYRDVIAAVRDLTVRGAPAIGVAAAMGIALGALAIPAEKPGDMRKGFLRICDEFSGSRPTARNLFWAIERMKRCFERESAGNADAGSVKKALVEEAIRIGEEDIEINRRIGLNGRRFINDGDCILTHCNAGALATAGYGTALGVIRAARDEGKTVHVYADETRPVLQGARLTCWELQKEGIPVTLITDSMAGSLMNRGKIRLVLVGADRIAANGDTANKIGTYTLAVLARENGIPFYVAAPLSTIDARLRGGKKIPIEERDEEEVSSFGGVRTAPEGTKVFNPAFDVTPHRYITAIITEAGIATRPYGKGIKALSSRKA